MGTDRLADGRLNISGTARTIALWVVLLAFFMDLLDTTIVNVAIPSIQKDLGASYSSIQWIVAGYALAFALFLITGGRLGDILGYKKLFITGIAGFTVASALCGLAPTTEFLIASRVLQGFMAAMMVPQILSLIQVMYNSEERQGISAFYGALAGIATVAGPILGALLITSDILGLEWRTIFLVNLPIGIASVVLAMIYLPDAKSPHPLRLDLIGVVLALIAMLMLMFPLIQGRELGWPAWTLISIAGSLAAFGLFAASQVWKDRRDGSPLVVPHLFRLRSFAAGTLLNGLFFGVVSGFFLIFTIFLQIGLGYSVLKAGLTGIPFSLGVSISAGSSGPLLVPRFGRKILNAGPIILAAGFGTFIWTINHFGAAVTPWELIPALVIGGIGMGCVVAPVFSFILAEVPLKDAGSASGVVNAAGQVGGAMGIAIVGVIFFGLLGGRADLAMEQVKPQLAADLAAAGIPAFAVPSVVDGLAACFHDRANATDFSTEPESCKQLSASQAAFAASQPDVAKKAGDAIAVRAREANSHNFIAAMSQTLVWQMVAVLVIFLLTFLLPPRPRTEAELARTSTPMAA
ncbi:MAG TPA: MFS transporter [Bauldia sp.]|nr:MFS transporter [Bauldia sp.]